MKRREIYFKDIEIKLETPLIELFSKYDSLLIEIDRLPPKIIEYFDRPVIIHEIIDYITKPSLDKTDYERTYKYPSYSQQLITDRSNFFLDIFLGVSLSAKYHKELEIKFKASYSKKVSSEEESSNSSSDSSSSSSSDSDDDENDNNSLLQRKRSKTDSLNSQLPIIIIEEKKKKSLISNENEKIEVEKEEEKIEEEYTQKRSKTYFKRGDMQKPMIEKQVEREEIVVVPKSIDYHYIEYLLKPLEEDLNDVVLGYLKKIVSEFLTRKPLEIEEFFYDRKKTRNFLLRKAHKKAISGIISEILIDKDYKKEQNNLNAIRFNNFMLSKKAFLQEILELMKNSGEDNIELLTGLSDAICDFLRSFSLPLIEKSNFLTFFSEKNINFLINLTLNAASCKQALSILVLCFENVFIPSISEEIKESLNYSFFLQKTLENLKTLSSYLRIKEEPYLNSLKIMIEPLGMSKLLIVILIKELLKRNEPIINESLFNSKILKDCFELIFRFQWNNALHCLIQEMFQFLTRNKNSDLLRQILEELELCNKMMKICQESKHKFRLGIIAFFIIFSNEINEICEDFDYIKDYMATSQLWGEFNAYWLKNTNRKQNTELGTGLFRKARLSSIFPPKELAEKYREILRSKELLDESDSVLDLPANQNDKEEHDSLDFSPSLPKYRLKHLSLFKCKSSANVSKETQLSMNKHHNSFSEEYEVLYNKNGSIKIKEKDEFQTGNEKKIIGLKKCDSEDFQFIENKEFSEEIFNSKIETDKKENEPIPEDY